MTYSKQHSDENSLFTPNLTETNKMYIFDLDGTISDFGAMDLYGSFRLWLTKNKPEQIAICSNQGGVGLRYWMKPRPDYKGFGDYTKYPLEEQVRYRLATVKEIIEATLGIEVYTYVSFRYQAKSGEWSPLPPGQEDNPEWSIHWRKPNPGMLLQAAADGLYEPEECVFVGDQDSDREAAAAINMPYYDQEDFFAVDVQIGYPKVMVVEWLKTQDRIGLNVERSFQSFERLLQERAKQWKHVGEVRCVPLPDVKDSLQITPYPDVGLIIDGEKFAMMVSDMAIQPTWLVYETPQDHMESLGQSEFRPTAAQLMETYGLSAEAAFTLVKEYE